MPRARARGGYVGVRVTADGLAVESPGGGLELVGFESYVRRNTHERPFAVVNDFIGTSVALALGVPVPPNAILEYRSERGHLSLAYGKGGMTTPPLTSSALKEAVKRDPWAATGIVVLDQWILNEDRYENVLQLPGRELVAIDHDNALLGHENPLDPTAALLASRDRILARHELVEHLPSWDNVLGWVTRAKAITDAELRRMCLRCYDSDLISASLRDALADFLIYRRQSVGAMMETLRKSYPAFTDDLLTSEEADPDDDGDGAPMVPGQANP